MPESSSTVQPQVVAQPAEILDVIQRARADGRRVGLVPTMGALHAGHLSLVRQSRSECDMTVVTIFVNPTQFGPHEDFATYPRTLPADVEKLSAERVGYVFAPPQESVYREGHSTYVEPPAVARPLEGEFRPGHFRGVATVVLKLFHMIPAHVAFFGRKDYQQTLVIRHMVADLDVPIDIRVCPTVREDDGLAKAAQMRAAGEQLASPVLEAMRTILAEAGVDRVDYVALVDPDTLESRERLDEPTIALIAAHVGGTRLIDNQML